ncbi:MAG: hypothetical protein PVI99_03725 [Anaerolineales bacterium]
MPKKFLRLLFIYITGVMLLTACGTAAQTTPTQFLEEQTEVEVATTPTTETALPTDTPEIVDECLNCHADKRRLIDTAKPEEEVIVENEGAG